MNQTVKSNDPYICRKLKKDTGRSIFECLDALKQNNWNYNRAKQALLSHDR